MKGNTPIGRAKCRYCGKEVPVAPTECYWMHVPDKNVLRNATKGQSGNYCTGSGESILKEQLQHIRSKQEGSQ